MMGSLQVKHYQDQPGILGWVKHLRQRLLTVTALLSWQQTSISSTSTRRTFISALHGTKAVRKLASMPPCSSTFRTYRTLIST